MTLEQPVLSPTRIFVPSLTYSHLSSSQARLQLVLTPVRLFDLFASLQITEVDLPDSIPSLLDLPVAMIIVFFRDDLLPDNAYHPQQCTSHELVFRC